MNVNSLILWKLPTLFSTVKLRSNFSNSSIDSKLGFFVLVLGYTSKFFPVNQEIFECCSSWISRFFPIQEKDEKLNFLNVSLGYTSRFFPIH